MKKFLAAFSGIAYGLTRDRSVQIQACIALITFALGIFLGIGYAEWLFVLLAAGAVVAVELLNSALEKLADHLHPGIDPRIKTIKDLSAASVMVASLAALAAGIVIFLPKLAERFFY